MNEARRTASDFEGLRDVIRARTGLVFPDSRERDLEAGIQRTLTSLGIADPQRLAERIGTDDRAFDALIANITVAETYFFREPKQFDAVRQQVLPDLRRRLLGDGQIRIWSAGCASGEEAYSLAILMEEEGLARNVTVLGTDISRAALARAREAAYSAWSLRDGADGRASEYFERRGDRFVLIERFRQRVEFKYLNLASGAYPSSVSGTTDMDLIVCRNVLIYFDAETIRRVARQLFECLRPGGWLIAGPSDPPLWDHAPFRTLVTGGGIIYRRDDGAEVQRPIVHAPIAAPIPDELLSPVLSPPEESPARPAVEAEPTIDLRSSIAEVRALADRGQSAQAEQRAAIAIGRYPLCAELHYLHAIVFMELRRTEDAIVALRRVIYLDPNLALAHFTLASILAQSGAAAEARRHYQNTVKLCLGRPLGEIAALSENESVAALADAARAQLAQLDRGMRIVR